MDINIINRIIDSLNVEETDDSMPYFSDKSYKPFKINKNNFHKIEKISLNKKIAFIDGGNTEIIKSASFSLQLIRVFYVIYKDNKKIDSKKYEIYVLVNVIKKDDKLSYETEIFNNKINLNKEDLRFDLYDESLKQGIHKIKIKRIGETVRKFAELKTAELLIDKLDDGDIIVRDGSLQSSITNENKYFNNLYKKALEKNIIITGLSKTSTLLTDKGNAITALLNMISPEGCWYYYPIVNINNINHKAEMFFIKLNEKSKHIFRFEVYKEQKFNIKEILGLLIKNANDPVFVGYPYGLIEADKFARISNDEKEYLKTILISKIGKNLNKLNKHTATINAHEILDKIT